MAIVKGTDFNSTYQKDGFLSGLYYYFLDRNMSINDNLTLPFQLPSIQTLTFLPFFNTNDFNVTETPLDYNYYKVNPNIKDIKVFRVIPQELKKELPTYKVNDFKFSLSLKEEQALNMYPYTYYLLSDGINPPLMIKPQDLKEHSITPVVETYITQSSKYKIYVKEHRNDTGGELESIINNTSFLLPIGTNVYNNFLVTSGNTYQATNSLAYLENNKSFSQASANLNLQEKMETGNYIANALSGLVGLVSGNVIGGLSQTGSSVMNHLYSNAKFDLSRQQNSENYNFKNYQIETMNLAKKSDFLNTPRAMKTLGNDGMFNLNNTNGKLVLYKFSINNNKKQQLNEYYKRYGYRVNSYKIPNTNNKKYFNFIKTVNCNIDSFQIPYEDIQGLEEIYNSGITFWHVENGVKVGDYSVNNEDV